MKTRPQLADARRKALITSARRYAWWLGNRSASTRKLLSLSGWKLSHLGYWLLGCPDGALAWPLGLSFLCANADRPLLLHDVHWMTQCFSGLVDDAGRALLTGTHVDRCGIGYAALRLYELEGDTRYLRFAAEMGDAVAALPRAASELIPYTAGRAEILVDTLAFVCPFFARLARITGRPDFAHTALYQLEEMYLHGFASTGGWVYHGFDSDSMQALGLAGWGRGTAWLLMAIVDTLHELPAGKDRARWEQRGLALLSQLADCQKADGHWPWRLDLPEAASDSSITALLAYSLARWQQGGLPCKPAFPPMLQRCRIAIDAATDHSGRVSQCSGEAAGIGLYSSHFGRYLWTQAPAVAADQICTGHEH